ncbi:MAG: hypothetical protein HYU66_12190 [Armatimonadetes bacterium]|nr:hypothetical protein [Armatimonadota bacterium]
MWQRRRVAAGAALAVVVLGGAVLLGCGGSEATGSDPPGTRIGGTGPCGDVNAAALRVLAQLLGFTPSRQAGVITGEGDDPTDVVYRLQNGVTPRGTTIRPYFDATGYTLNADYFVFFVDPSVLANWEHPASYVYVRPSDGALFVQSVTAFPVVGGVIRLTSDADRRANLVYLHEGLEDVAFHAAGRQARQMTNSNGGGLWLGGSDEERRDDDLQNAAEFMQDLTGEANPISVLWHNHPDPIDEDDLAEKLRTASLGMGAGDKFFLFISTHGSAPPGSQIQVGNDFITYEELCRLINENVTAGHVNIFNGACFGGAMSPVFLECDQHTTKAFHWFSDTDAATSSWSCPDNLGTSEALEQLAAAVAAARAGGGGVSLAQVEAAMGNLNVTDADIIAALCKCLEGSPLHDEICLNFETTDGPDDDYPRPGHPQTGGFPQDPPAPQQLALEERRLPITLGNGTGTIGLDPVNTSNGTGTIIAPPDGLPYMSSFFDVFTEFTLSSFPPSTGTAEFSGPIIQISRQGDPFRELLDGGDDVITIPTPGNDPDDRVWAAWRGDLGRVDCLFPPLPISQVVLPREPILIGRPG